jgi:hypothetical protein
MLVVAAGRCHRRGDDHQTQHPSHQIPLSRIAHHITKVHKYRASRDFRIDIATSSREIGRALCASASVEAG